ncbi:MAG: SdrD B-like domain-containing protein [Thiolinea sp.]
MRPEFKTTLGWAHDRSESDVSTYPTAGLSARYWVNSGLSLGVNLRATARDSNLSTSRGLSGSLNTEYEAGNGWRFGAAAHINQARVDVNNNDTDATGVTRSDDKSVYLYTRWDGNAGKPFPLLGRNRNGSGGSGSVSGVVYFDLNRDGEQQADEQGVAGVDVLLDGAYSSRTDRHGKFEFVRVTTGKHELSLDMNSVPLPWGESEAGNRFDVVVPLRGRIDKRIAVIRPEN